MSNVSIYFGAPTTPSQVVAAEVKEKGLELLRVSPSDLSISVVPTHIQPNYSIYKSLLPRFIYSAAFQKKVKLSDSPFCTLPEAPQFPLPSINVCFSWSKPPTEEVVHELRMVHKAIDTRIRGKPAMFIANPSVETIKHVLNTNASDITPTIEDTINIQAFRQLRFIAKLASGFLKLHQYPAFLDENHTDGFQMGDVEVTDVHTVAVPTSSGEDVPMVDSVSYEAVNELASENSVFPVNLDTPFKDAPITFTTQTVPPGSGLFIPFVYELARFDPKTVPSVISQYFYHGLGEDAEEAHDTFCAIREAWGSIYKSKCGDVLSHLFKVIELALRGQARVAPIVQNGNYLGCGLMGAGYSVMLYKKIYNPVPRQELMAVIGKADSHTEALWKIMLLIQFVSNDDRLKYFKACKRMSDLKKLLDGLSSGGATNHELILKYASKLAFADDKDWVHTAANIETALLLIADPLRDIYSVIPSLHYTVLFSSVRRHLVWSAFGSTAPSFRVPGGRVQDLSKPFVVSIRQKDGGSSLSNTKEVTKVACAIVPLSLALRHLDEVFESREIMNPFANAQVRVSTSNINKEFDGESCKKIVDALRKVTNTVVHVAASSAKRSGESNDSEASKKRAKKYDF